MQAVIAGLVLTGFSVPAALWSTSWRRKNGYKVNGDPRLVQGRYTVAAMWTVAGFGVLSLIEGVRTLLGV